MWKIIFGLLIEKNPHLGEGSSSYVELDNREDIIEPQNLEEKERQKVEISGSQDVVTIEDIPKDTPVITNVFIKEEIKRQLLAKAIFGHPLPSTNHVLIQVHENTQIEVTSTIYNAPSISHMVTVE